MAMPIRATVIVIALLAVGAGPPGSPDVPQPPAGAGRSGPGQTVNAGSGGEQGVSGWPPQWGPAPTFAGQPAVAPVSAPAVLLPPGAEPPPSSPPPENLHHFSTWPEVWGFLGVKGVYAGTRMAPNGLTFGPLFDVDSELNIGLLPHKYLYLFVDTDFWGQRATNGVTNPHQGSFDFSKREFDITGGLAWNYWGPFEFRAWSFAYNNLNRGIDLNLPYGYNDGVAIENRLYLYRPGVDIYDVGRVSFVSIGYMPSKSITGLDGQVFNPGLYLHGYLTRDLPGIRSYLYADGQYIGEAGLKARLLLGDVGLAVRPFPNLQNLEFRVGGSDTFDVQVNHGEAVGYVGVRVQF
jgi:hypothetical protein